MSRKKILDCTIRFGGYLNNWNFDKKLVKDLYRYEMTDKTPKMQTSHAILMLSGKYVLQLRDDKPSISAPGEWSLFGGMLNDGEVPSEGIKREIFEELNIKPQHYRALWYMDYYLPLEKKDVRTWLFEAEVDKVWGAHKLNEGKDVKALSYHELKDIKIPDVMRKALERHHKERERING